MRMCRSRALVAEKHVDHLPRHVERGQHDPDEHEVMRQVRHMPMRGGLQDFLFRPTSRKKERHTAEIHHADGVGKKRDRHEPAQSAHFANVLLVVTAVNDRAGAEKQKRFEKPMRDQVHNAGRNTTDAERDHHQAQLRHS